MDDVLLVTQIEVEINYLMKVLEDFCELIGLKVNKGETKAMLRNTRSKKEKTQPEIMYKGHTVKAVDSFK